LQTSVENAEARLFVSEQIAMEHDVGKDGSGMARSKRIMIREVATLGIDIALG
jgi:hypothetical protein